MRRKLIRQEAKEGRSEKERAFGKEMRFAICYDAMF